MQEKRAASVVDGSLPSALDGGYYGCTLKIGDVGPLQTWVEMLDFSRKLPVLAQFSILTNPHIYW